MSESRDRCLRALGGHFRPEPPAAERAREWLQAAETRAAKRARTKRRLVGGATAAVLAGAGLWLLLPRTPAQEPSPVLIAWADEVLEAGALDAEAGDWIELDLPAEYEDLSKLAE
jgi:glutathione S-transferase